MPTTADILVETLIAWENFRKALPETPGREQIEASTSEEPVKSMMDAGS